MMKFGVVILLCLTLMDTFGVESKSTDTNAKADDVLPNNNGAAFNEGQINGQAYETGKHNQDEIDQRRQNENNGDLTHESEILEAEEHYLAWLQEYFSTGMMPEASTEVQQFLDDNGIPLDTVRALYEKQMNSGRGGRKRRSYLASYAGVWTKCIIPYVYESITESDKIAMENVHKYWEKYTGFRFVEFNATTTKEAYGLDHNNYIRYVRTSGCWSYVGNLRGNGQRLAPCGGGSASIHELGHAFGMQHEQENPQSFPYVRPEFDNIKPDYRSQYYRSDIDGLHDITGFYDISSRMHYSTWAFNGNHRRTMTSNDPDYLYLIDSGNDYYMFKELQEYHNCYDEFDSCDVRPTCFNGGYVSVIDGKCQCRCPPELNPDTNCTTKLELGCGELVVFNEGETSYTFTSPNYPENYDNTMDCFWHFTSPEGARMQLDFNDFEVSASDSPSCNDHVEISFTKPSMKGFSVCGHGYKKTIWTWDNFLSLKMVTKLGNTYKGFNATITVFRDTQQCYNGDGSDGSYTGDVNYTKSFQPCIPWYNATKCLFNKFDSKAADWKLKGDTCRNVVLGTQPWCYTNADTCERQNCDACMWGSCYDVFVDCEEQLAKDEDYCMNNELGEAHRGCMETCGLCQSRVSQSRGSCAVPTDVKGITPVSEKTSYDVGDVVTYNCPISRAFRISTCTSDGSWSKVNFVCGSCPTGFAPFNQRCFNWLGYTVKVDHDTAVAMCNEKGSVLVKVDSPEVSKFVQRLVKYDEHDSTNVWMGAKPNSERVWRWSDGSLVPDGWTNWESGQPNNYARSQNCAQMQYNELWDDTDCTNMKSVVCEYQFNSCPNGLAPFNERCFNWFGNSVKVDHDTAVAMCNEKGSVLVKVDSPEVSKFLQHLVYSDEHDSTNVWMGAEPNSERVWRWSDGSLVSDGWTNWESGQPNNYARSQNCAQMQYNELWDDTDCTNLRSVVCEYHFDINHEESVCEDQSDECEADLQNTPDMCSKYSDYSWHNCRKSCGVGECRPMTTCADDTYLGYMATRITGHDSISVGEHIEYQCNDGYYKSSGDALRACLTSGNLTGSPLICLHRDVTTNVDLFTDKEIYKRLYTGTAQRYVIANVTDMTFTVSGKVTAWTFFSNYAKEIAFAVWRFYDNETMAMTPRLIGQNVIKDNPNERKYIYRVPEAEQIYAEVGDVIGIYQHDLELSYTRCAKSLEPEHATWLQTESWKSQVSEFAVGEDHRFETSSVDCQIYSIRASVNPSAHTEGDE